MTYSKPPKTFAIRHFFIEEDLTINMTSTPVSLNDGSLEGSWVDIRCATLNQAKAPNENPSPESLDCRASPYSMVESMHNLGRVSFQVQRFLQESQRSAANIATSSSQADICRLNNMNDDTQSLVYLSDSEGSQDGFDRKALYESLKLHNGAGAMDGNIDHQTINMNDLQYNKNQTNNLPFPQQRKSSKIGDCLADQLSDSLSLLSRASGGVIPKESNFEELDWIWDWTAQPEYFTGQEWKVYAPKQEYLMRQRQLYKNPEGESTYSTDVASLLVLTNVLSIIIGAGLTYGILVRKNGV